MRAVGIDIASAGYTAVALVTDGNPMRAAVWKPSNPKNSVAVNLDEFHKWLTFKLHLYKPHVISVEELAVFLNKSTIRALARHEGVALLTAKQSGALVVSPGITKSRGIVFNNGKMSKDDAWLAFKKLYPDLKLLPKNSGGTDQMDAYTHALAAPTVLERK